MLLVVGIMVNTETMDSATPSPLLESSTPRAYDTEVGVEQSKCLSRCKGNPSFQKFLTLHCWLEHVRNSKKMAAQAKHIFDTFEYFRVDHKSKFFCNCLVTRWRHHRFC